jgi:hypothetical protein
MTEAETLLRDWKAEYAKRHPYRDPEKMPVDDATLALGVLLRREIKASNLDGLRNRDLDQIDAV